MTPTISTVPSAAPASGPLITPTSPQGTRLGLLDGWRGISILLVLAAHMLPLGPSWLDLNHATALAGMSIFFTLSGFLIASAIQRHPSVLPFLIRRACRILPIGYLATLVYLLLQDRTAWGDWAAHLFFYLNYDHAHMTPLTSHFWSLCVEVQFYAFVALLALVAGVRGLVHLPFIGLLVTSVRVFEAIPINIKTHLRIDEILAGSLLAMIWLGRYGRGGRTLATAMARVPLSAWIAAFAISCHPYFGPALYARPYTGAALVGHTLLAEHRHWGLLRSRWLRYVAEISYALYIIHPLSMAGWLGEGERFSKYARRPLSIAITFGLAHLSTFHFERPIQAWGRRIAQRISSR